MYTLLPTYVKYQFSWLGVELRIPWFILICKWTVL